MSLETRMGNRSIQMFKEHLILDHKKQNVWSKAFEVFLSESFDTLVKCIEHGVDNTGGLIEGNLPNNNVDCVYVLTYKDKSICPRIEIKTIPEHIEKFMTFKVSSLKSCLKEKAYILVPKRYKFYLFGTKICEILLKNYHHKIYENFSDNDLAVRIFKSDIEKFLIEKKIIVKNWNESSRKIIEKNWDLLSKKR